MAGETYYSTPAEVIAFTGVQPDDLGFKTDNEAGDTPAEQLTAQVTTWLEEIKDLIDQDRGKDYAAGTIPKGIHNIAKRACANMVMLAIQRRQSPIIRVDDFNIKMADDKIFTPALKEDLSRFPAARRFRFFVSRYHDPDEEA